MTPQLLAFRVTHGSWQAGPYGPFAGTVEIPRPPAELVRLAAHAHAAGAIAVTEGLEAKHVQTQTAGEKAQRAAQRDGSWHEGNRAQAAVEGRA